jgi:cytochrome c553
VTPRAACRAALAVCLAAAVPALAHNATAPAQSVYAERFASVCAACHGPQGHSTQALTPSLGGQPSFYAITQLFLFREGRRDNPLMTAVAKGMSDDDLRGFSDLIGTLAPPAPAPAVDASRAARGAALANRLHCTGCHGGDLAGGRQVPRLAGQREDYLLLALRGFRSASRVGYTPAMSEALAGVAPDQLEDLAHYLATVKP